MFEPSFNDLKFTAWNHSYLCNLNTLFLWYTTALSSSSLFSSSSLEYGHETGAGAATLNHEVRIHKAESDMLRMVEHKDKRSLEGHVVEGRPALTFVRPGQKYKQSLYIVSNFKNYQSSAQTVKQNMFYSLTLTVYFIMNFKKYA